MSLSKRKFVAFIIFLAALVAILTYLGIQPPWIEKSAERMSEVSPTGDSPSNFSHELGEPRIILTDTYMSPNKLYDEINSAPPFQRDQVSNNFVGNHVDWSLYFWGADKITGGRARVSLVTHLPEHGFIPPMWIVGNVKLADYSALKTMEQGEPLRVKGRISEISGTRFHLDDMRLTLE